MHVIFWPYITPTGFFYLLLLPPLQKSLLWQKSQLSLLFAWSCPSYSLSISSFHLCLFSQSPAKTMVYTTTIWWPLRNDQWWVATASCEQKDTNHLSSKMLTVPLEMSPSLLTFRPALGRPVHFGQTNLYSRLCCKLFLKLKKSTFFSLSFYR